MSSKVMVSIYCLAYNHEKYIRSALDGFITQQCSFKYEVIIHDDASTDRTAEIIREYEKKYPDIIKPIYQEENQYSRKVSIYSTFIAPKLKGKYIAICEGDDYWIDSYKLQKQVDYMEKNRNCTLCCTNGFIKDMKKGGEMRNFVPYTKEDKENYHTQNQIYTLDNSYQLSFLPTASFLYRKDAMDCLPDYYNECCQHGDLRKRLFLTALGYMYYMDDKTCVYREHVSGSAMTRWKAEDKQKKRERSLQVIHMIDNVDKFSDYKHSVGLLEIKKIHITTLLRNEPSFKMLRLDLKNPDNMKVFRRMSLKRKGRVIISCFF